MALPSTTTIISADDAGSRLDRYFKRHYPSLTHGMLEKALRKGDIRLEGKKTTSNTRIEEGQTLTIPVMLTTMQEAPAPQVRVSDKHKQMLLDSILYKDDHIIVINKPNGLAVQGGSNIKTSLDDLLDVLRFEKAERPKLVHRLDKDTSGVLVLARSSKAATLLTEAFRHKTIEKYYWAAVVGTPPQKEGKIDAPLSKTANINGYEQVGKDEEGDRALTYYRMIDGAKGTISWLEMKPVTGRTHQLRVHAKLLGTPIAGDGKYGGREAFIAGISNKLHLHARELVLPPLFGKAQRFVAPLPSHMQETWEMFGFAVP